MTKDTMRYPSCACFDGAASELARNIQIDEFCMKACAYFNDSLDKMHLCDDATLFVVGALLSGYCVGHMSQTVGLGWTDRLTNQHIEHLHRLIDDAAQHAKERSTSVLRARMKHQ